MIEKLLKRGKKEEQAVPVKVSLGNMLQASHLPTQVKFNNIMKVAKEILDDKSISIIGEHPIFDYIRILGRGLQSDYMKLRLYYSNDEDLKDVPDLSWDIVGFDRKSIFVGKRGDNVQFDSLVKKVNCSKKINLSRDLILPWPWNKDSFIDNIVNIGKGRKKGEWRQDKHHTIKTWVPIGVSWVSCGNHTITMGIIQGGEAEPEYCDMSEVYEYVKCDGKNYIRTKTNSLYNDEILAPVTNVEFAAIFEIGRMLVEREISFID